MNLKPCPFCGSLEADFENHPETCFLYRLERNVTHRHTYCIEEMWKSWNIRPLEDEMLEALIELRDTFDHPDYTIDENDWANIAERIIKKAIGKIQGERQ